MREARFLVVDDSPTVVMLICGVIQAKLGAEQIMTATGGRDAIEKLKRYPVDLIVSDWNMADMNGDELLYFVRNHEKLKDVPFVMVSSNSHKDFIITALQLGVTQYLVKPFTPDELERKIRNSWNAASKRGSERYSSLPPHRALVHAGGGAIEAEIINISRTGVQFSLPFSERIALYGTYDLALSFRQKATGEACCTLATKGQVVRLEANRMDTSTCFVAMTIAPATLAADQGQQFEQLLAMLAKRTPKLINND